MDQAKHKAGFSTWLRRTWTMVMLALEGIDRSPMEDVIDRLDRLERGMARARGVETIARAEEGRRKNG